MLDRIEGNGDNLTETDDPAKIMMRQIAGAFAQYEKARLVAELRGARDRRSAAIGKRVEGRKGYSDSNPELVREAKRLARKNPKTGEKRSLRRSRPSWSGWGSSMARGSGSLPMGWRDWWRADRRPGRLSCATDVSGG